MDWLNDAQSKSNKSSGGDGSKTKGFKIAWFADFELTHVSSELTDDKESFDSAVLAVGTCIRKRMAASKSKLAQLGNVSETEKLLLLWPG